MKGVADLLFILIWFFVELIATAIINIYIIAHFSHSNETALGKMKITKIIIWIGLTLIMMPFFLVHMDVKLNNIAIIDSGIIPDEPAYGIFWWINNTVQALYVLFLCPTMIFLYNTNEKQPLYLRIYTALKLNVVWFFVFFLYILFTALWCR